MATIKQMAAYVKERYGDLTSSERSKGMCATVSEDVQDAFGIKNLIYTYHTNDPDYRYSELGQHCDHFAIMHMGKVLDFTLSQFDANAPFPFYGSISEWKTYLEDAWETDVNHYIIDEASDAEYLTESD